MSASDDTPKNHLEVEHLVPAPTADELRRRMVSGAERIQEAINRSGGIDALLDVCSKLDSRSFADEDGDDLIPRRLILEEKLRTVRDVARQVQASSNAPFNVMGACVDLLGKGGEGMQVPSGIREETSPLDALTYLAAHTGEMARGLVNSGQTNGMEQRTVLTLASRQNPFSELGVATSEIINAYERYKSLPAQEIS